MRACVHPPATFCSFGELHISLTRLLIHNSPSFNHTKLLNIFNFHRDSFFLCLSYHYKHLSGGENYKFIHSGILWFWKVLNYGNLWQFSWGKRKGLSINLFGFAAEISRWKMLRKKIRKYVNWKCLGKRNR